MGENKIKVLQLPKLCNKQNICVKNCARNACDNFFSEIQHCVRASISIISLNKVKRETGESEQSVVRILLVQQCGKNVYITIKEVKENLATKGHTHSRRKNERKIHKYHYNYKWQEQPGERESAFTNRKTATNKQVKTDKNSMKNTKQHYSNSF